MENLLERNVKPDYTCKPGGGSGADPRTVPPQRVLQP